MKKFAFLSVLLSVFLIGSAFAADDIRDACYPVNRCGAKTNMRAITTTAGVVAGLPVLPVSILLGAGGYALGGPMSKAYTANEYIYFDDGTCLECDTYQMGEHYECPNGAIVSNGKAVLKCQTKTFGDKWIEHSLYPCSNSQIQNAQAKDVKMEISANISKSVKPGVQVLSGDACLMISCEGNKKYDQKQNKCVSGSAPVNPVKPVVPVNPPVAPAQPEDVNVNLDVNINAEVNIAFDCTTEDIKWLNEVLLYYKSDTKITSMAQAMLDYCKDPKRTRGQYNEYVGQLTVLISLYKEPVTVSDTESSLRRINSTVELLSGIEAGFGKATVWKNDEGKFNTKRLVSDSVAGVVLGTAGGLITSNVIKKNQVANGFEDISCTVGGQVVAGWDDQFSVGIR